MFAYRLLSRAGAGNFISFSFSSSRHCCCTLLRAVPIGAPLLFVYRSSSVLGKVNTFLSRQAPFGRTVWRRADGDSCRRRRLRQPFCSCCPKKGLNFCVRSSCSFRFHSDSTITVSLQVHCRRRTPDRIVLLYTRRRRFIHSFVLPFNYDQPDR